MNRRQHGFVDWCRTTQIPLSLVRHSRLQVARTTMTVIRLAGSAQAESFFCPFMCLLFGHVGSVSRRDRPRASWGRSETRHYKGFPKRRKGAIWRKRGLGEGSSVDCPRLSQSATFECVLLEFVPFLSKPSVCDRLLSSFQTNAHR